MNIPPSSSLTAASDESSPAGAGQPCKGKSEGRLTWPMVLALLGINFLYASTGVFCKMASRQAMGSFGYWLCVGGALGVLGTYAVLWQQILARVPISSAYMFRGTALVFALCLAAVLWGESITCHNLAGAAILAVGITLYVRP